MTVAHVLVVDDDPEMSAMLVRHLESEDMAVVAATGGRAALTALEAHDFDVVVTDLVMDAVGGLDVLLAAGRCRPAPRVILMTAFGTLGTAIEAMRQGAYDYLTKPFKLAEVTVAVRRALDDYRLRRENERLRAVVERQHGLDRILGRSKVMQETVSQIRAVAESAASVLLLGESGTGKELVAQAIHWASSRRGGRLVAVNCAAVPETLLESELFGHEKGAFTGADRRREGLFAAASGGTLFLDEIGDMPLATQAKLLRVLQDRAVRPLGGSASVHLDLRIVAATNKDLPAMVKDGRFREDLYYRLAVIPIRLPSLRERPEDIMLIAEHYLRETVARLGKSIQGFDATAVHWMERHTWPGNVRELENVVERAVVLARDASITRSDLGTEFTLDQANSPLRPTLATLEGNMCAACSTRSAATRPRRRRSSACRCGRFSGGLESSDREAGSSRGPGPTGGGRLTRADRTRARDKHDEVTRFARPVSPRRAGLMTGCRRGDKLSRPAPHPAAAAPQEKAVHSSGVRGPAAARRRGPLVARSPHDGRYRGSAGGESGVSAKRDDRGRRRRDAGPSARRPRTRWPPGARAFDGRGPDAGARVLVA